MLLSFLNFYKKNKNYILYLHKEYYSDQVKNPKWEKTIRNNLPILTSGKTPVYIRIRNTKKIINREEELIIYFFSILNYFNEEHNLFIQIDNSYKLYTGSSFKKLQKNGLSKLKKIKHRYFSNTLRSMYHLCKIYFSQTDNSSEKKKREEFLSVKSYNLVFEDMIDKLFSDQLSEKTVDGVSMKDLKYNEDGKIIDHIYDYQSIIDTSNIFYIGDSKYYKSNYEAGRLSKYKQFTYAKNVIQFNIDLLNEGKIYKENIRYRDELTEGYNITPNFFIYGYIQDEKNFNEHLIEKISEPIKSSHFPERLFDRDTLFVHQYKINFLYVLRAYSNFSMNKILRFRKNIKATFRNNIIDYFNDESKCEYILYKCKLNREKLSKFVDDNFRLLNGKCFRNNEGDLLLAVHSNDKTLKDIMAKFDKIRLEKQNMEFTPI